MSKPLPMTPGPAWSRRIPFRVDIAGVIEILGSALYSRPEAAVRELIQNAHDAVIRRRRVDLGYLGRIDVEQDAEAGILRFSDDGIGLSPEEAETFLSTLGIGLTGLLKGRSAPSVAAEAAGIRPAENQGGDGLIGQFGIGLFSAFMLADRVEVVSRRRGLSPQEAVRWEAGAGTEITLSAAERSGCGTTVSLILKPDHRGLAEDPEALEAVLKTYADFLPIPIHINGASARLNVIHASWFDPTPDSEAMALELEATFDETPLDVIPVRCETPVALAGSLYVTPRRVPGFAGESVVTATVRRMVISRRIQGLLPEWAPFVRGVLELPGGTPTLSREDLVRDSAFEQGRETLERLLYEHFEELARKDRTRFDSVLAWHRYTLAGAALTHRRLRDLLRHTYTFTTSRGPLTFDAIREASGADPVLESEVDVVIWFQSDRRQERWANELFAGAVAPCVHALRSFEEALLAAMVSDCREAGVDVDLRLASPGSPGFAETILDVSELEDAPETWQDFLVATGAKILVGSFREDVPVLAFLNERSELIKTFDDLKARGTIPEGFRRMIDAHLSAGPAATNEVLLNRKHRLVGRALKQKTSSPLASVLRLLVHNALGAAGASSDRQAHRQLAEDLDWIAEALWGREP